MEYPNLAAEVQATGQNEGIAFRCLADSVDVTEQLLRRIVWGNEDVKFDEAYALYNALTPYGNREHYSFEYLFSSVPATVKPGTNKTKYRIHTLRKLLEEAESLTPPHWWTEQRKRAWRTLSAMERGIPVYYSYYRFAVNIAQRIIADCVYESRRQIRDIDEMEATA